jgi:hypothetical protein
MPAPIRVHAAELQRSPLLTQAAEHPACANVSSALLTMNTGSYLGQNTQSAKVPIIEKMSVV